MTYAIGIDVGGTNIKTVAVSLAGEPLFQTTEPTDEARPAWAERIRAQITCIQRERGGDALCIGLAAPGLAARDGRSIAWMQGRMEILQGLDWTDYLQAAQTVPVLNDAHAALLGEAWIGAAAGIRNVCMLTLGTGVGGGAILEGRLLQGHIGRAGHLGHLCLNPDGPPDIVGTPGSLEDAIGDCTIRQRTNGRFSSTAELVQAYREGDNEATKVWLRAVWHLACGMTSLINVLDPEVFLLGGGIAQAGNALFAPLAQYLDQLEWRPTGSKVRVAPAALGDMAGAFGAASHALRQRENSSTN